MYGILKIGGSQYRVQAGDVIDVQRLDGEVGTDLTLDQVLFVDGKVGTPTVSGAKATAKIVRQARDRKLIVFTRKPRSGARRKKGHRQHYTSLLITALNNGSKETKADKAILDKYKK